MSNNDKPLAGIRVRDLRGVLQLPALHDDPKQARREAYQARRLARIDRLRRASAKAARAASQAHQEAHTMAKVIPLGQPILVGHHSEGRDRRYRGRIEKKFRKSFELQDQAQDLARRAKAAENNKTVSSDDPDAVDKLREKVAKLRKNQEAMKAANSIVRSKKKSDEEKIAELAELLHWTEQEAAGLLKPDFAGRAGFPDYKTRNNSANIRRIEKRIVELEKRQTEETTECQVGEVRIVRNVELNRLQVSFPEKPGRQTRERLRRHGFRWAPTIEAWQRHLSNGAEYDAKQCIKGDWRQ